MGEYLFPVEKLTSYFKSINSINDLQKFIQQRSAHVTQNTLYGYLKTRMGHKFTLMVDDEEFSKSINIAKWNIYTVALADCVFYTFSFLMSEKNLQNNDSKDIYLNIIKNEKNNGLSDEIFEKAASCCEPQFLSNLVLLELILVRGSRMCDLRCTSFL